MNFLFTFNRKIADKIFVPFLLKTPLRPNHVTALSLVSGLTAGFAMSGGSRSGLLWGTFFLQLSFILDDCDGTIARLKNLRSDSGMWFDLIADIWVDMAVWAGLAWGAVSQGESVRVAWWLFAAAAAGSLIHFGHVIQDRLKGKTGKETSGDPSPFLAAVHVLGHDGDPSALFWMTALFLQPAQILFLGAVYIHFLWILSRCFGL